MQNLVSKAWCQCCPPASVIETAIIVSAADTNTANIMGEPSDWSARNAPTCHLKLTRITRIDSLRFAICKRCSDPSSCSVRPGLDSF